MATGESAPSWRARLYIPAVVLWVAMTLLWLDAFSYAEGGLAAGSAILLLLLGFGAAAWSIRKGGGRLLEIGLVGVGVAAGVFAVGSGVGGVQRSLSQMRGDKVVLALDNYQEKNGVYPDSLLQLVPGFLRAVPTTAMGVLRHHDFTYEKADDAFGLSFPAGFFVVCSRRADGKWVYSD